MSEADLKMIQWADELRAEFSTWPREELIALIIEIQFKDGIRRAGVEVMETGLKAGAERLKAKTARAAKVEKLLKTSQKKMRAKD